MWNTIIIIVNIINVYIIGNNKQMKNNKSSLTLPVTKTKERSSTGTFNIKSKQNLTINFPY